VCGDWKGCMHGFFPFTLMIPCPGIPCNNNRPDQQLLAICET
jgi:hypothetical protein